MYGLNDGDIRTLNQLVTWAVVSPEFAEGFQVDWEMTITEAARAGTIAGLSATAWVGLLQHDIRSVGDVEELLNEIDR